jgi:hypothetical protein
MACFVVKRLPFQLHGPARSKPNPLSMQYDLSQSGRLLTHHFWTKRICSWRILKVSRRNTCLICLIMMFGHSPSLSIVFPWTSSYQQLAFSPSVSHLKSHSGCGNKVPHHRSLAPPQVGPSAQGATQSHGPCLVPWWCSQAASGVLTTGIMKGSLRGWTWFNTKPPCDETPLLDAGILLEYWTLVIYCS